jgi:hypothetical protein
VSSSVKRIRGQIGLLVAVKGMHMFRPHRGLYKSESLRTGPGPMNFSEDGTNIHYGFSLDSFNF